MIIENRALWLARSFAISRYNHRAVIITLKAPWLKASSFQNGSQICWCFGVGNRSIQGVPKVHSSYYMWQNFWSKLHVQFCMKFFKTFVALLSTYTRKVNIRHALLCFFITFRSRCGMEWDNSWSVESGIFFQVCLSRLFRYFMVLGVGYL